MNVVFYSPVVECQWGLGSDIEGDSYDSDSDSEVQDNDDSIDGDIDLESEDEDIEDNSLGFNQRSCMMVRRNKGYFFLNYILSNRF